MNTAQYLIIRYTYSEISSVTQKPLVPLEQKRAVFTPSNAAFEQTTQLTKILKATTISQQPLFELEFVDSNGSIAIAEQVSQDVKKWASLPYVGNKGSE